MALAFAILVDHAVLVTSGGAGQVMLFSGPGRAFVSASVPMFCSLSGFLVASSLMRCQYTLTFLGLRILRIFPALIVDTLFCALVLGVAMTHVPLSEYFRSPDFFKYFLNLFGDIHYKLPGVFETLPDPQVNAQLWTIPYQIYFYLLLSALAIFGLHRNRKIFLSAVFLIIVGISFYSSSHKPLITDVWQLTSPSFLIGVALYIYQDKIEYSGRMVLIAIFLAIALLSQTNFLMVFAALPLSYLTVWLGLLRPERGWLIRSGDYSYPFYLYSFPLQQVLAELIPICREWWINLLVATPISLVFAAVSWHLIEKPAQKQRHRLYALESWLNTRYRGLKASSVLRLRR